MASPSQQYQQAQAVFDSIDRDRDGQLSREEFEQAVRSLRGAWPSPAPAPWQTQSAPQPLQPARNPQLEALFDSMDRDNDGRLNPEEFQRLLRSIGQAPSPAPAPPAPVPIAWPTPPAFPLLQKRVEVDTSGYTDRVFTNLLMWIGFFLFCLLSLVPLWNASVLLRDSSYVYFATLDAVWGLVTVAEIIAVCILLYFLVDARAALANLPCCIRPKVDIPDVDISADIPSVSIGRCARLFRCFDGLRMAPWMPRMKLEAVIVGIVAIVLIIVWSLLPHAQQSLFALPIVGPVLKLCTMPFAAFGGLLQGSLGPLFSAMLSFFSLSTIVNGANAATGVVLSVWATLILYVVTICAFVRSRGKPHLRSGQSLACVWAVYALALGVLFLAFAGSITEDAYVAYNEIFTSCPTGARTGAIYETSQALQSLRSESVCQQVGSVAECAGYVDSAYANYLKDMEKDYKCRGFCYDPASLLLPRPANATAASLFETTAPYRTSCDGAAARTMDGVVAGSGEQIRRIGLIIILVALCVLVLRFADIWLKIDHDMPGHENAGSAPFHDYGSTGAHRNHGF